jgi:hypothetical protein
MDINYSSEEEEEGLQFKVAIPKEIQFKSKMKKAQNESLRDLLPKAQLEPLSQHPSQQLSESDDDCNYFTLRINSLYSIQ